MPVIESRFSCLSGGFFVVLPNCARLRSEIQYGNWTVLQLRSELRIQGLQHTGSKTDLVGRLHLCISDVELWEAW